MSRPKRQKIDRESMAAYSASQPLFDTLRNASDKLADQEAHLTDARNVVQKLHVKIANNDDNFSINRHHEYMDAAVKAWHSATETYCAIFEQLVTITAADPTEGREKGQRHEEFVSLLETARKAEEMAKQFGAGNSNGSTDAGDDEGDEVVEPAAQANGTGKRPMAAAQNEKASEKTQKKVQSKAYKEPAANPPLKQSALSEDIRYDKSGANIIWQNGELKVPYKSLNAEEKRAWDIIKTRQRRKGRVAKMKLSGQKEQANASPGLEPHGEWEDVSAEVEQRIKAKRDKKAAEKAKSKEKKRKRESGDSFTAAVDSGFTNAGGEEEKAAQEGTSKEKPAKKRARQSKEAEDEPKAASTPTPAPASGGKSKRKKSLDAETEVKVDEGAGKVNKKRKKGNA